MVVLTCIHGVSATAEMPSPGPSSGDQAQSPDAGSCSWPSIYTEESMKFVAQTGFQEAGFT